MRSSLSFLLVALPLCAQDGAALFQQRCASCHDGGVNRAPVTAALKQMSAENVLNALKSGVMTQQAAGMSEAELRAVSEFVSGKKIGESPFPKQAFCSDAPALPDRALADPHWNGWGVDATNHRFQPAAMARLTAADVPRLKLKWAFAFPGDARAFAQPTVLGGRLFVGSAGRRVYSLNAASGCIYWTADTDAPVRSAITVARRGRQWFAYFGDQRANAYAIDAMTGKVIWKVRVDEHPLAMITGAPTLYEDRLYVPTSSSEEVAGSDAKYSCCTFRGSITALDAANGKTIWKSYSITDAPQPTKKNAQGVQLYGPSGAGIWSAPTIDARKRVLYVNTGDNYSDPPARTSDAFLAMDLATGKILWSRQMTENDAFVVSCSVPGAPTCPEANGPDFDFGQSPMLVDLPNGRRALIAGQKSGMVHAVNPDQQGEVLWQARVGRGSALGGVQWGSAVDDANVYAAVSDVAARPPAAGSAASEPKTGPGLYALKLTTGERVWATPHPPCGQPGCRAAQSAAVTAIPGVVFSGSMDGHLRAYAAADGKIIWDVNTAQTYQTVNGVTGKGGAIDGPGAVVTGGLLYVNSGNGFFGAAPGNVLLAFSVDGK
jgi:polyvinyl alcohol dehydrogenase (cytochrome)